MIDLRWKTDVGFPNDEEERTVTDGTVTLTKHGQRPLVASQILGGHCRQRKRPSSDGISLDVFPSHGACQRMGFPYKQDYVFDWMCLHTPPPDKHGSMMFFLKVPN